MGIFRRRPVAVPEPAPEARGWSLPNGLYAPTSQLGWSTAGVPVTLQTALHNAGAWACQRVLVSTISMLPVDAYRTVDKRLVELNTQPAVVSNPSGRVSRRGWVAQVVRAGTSSGNMYGRIVSRDRFTNVSQIETIHPDKVSWSIIDGEEVAFVNGARQVLWDEGGDFWHVPISQFLQPGSRVAMSPTEYGKTAIGTGIAAEQYGTKFFTAPQFMASVPTEINEEQAIAIKGVLTRMANGGTDPGVLGSDIKLQPWMVDPKNSQFIDLLRFEVEQSCRIWGVPPSMVFAAISGQNVTYANVSQADLQFLKFSVQAWVSDLEDAWSAIAAMPHSVRFNTDAVLRMDALTRAELASKRLADKTTTVNDVRALEDEPPFPDPAYDLPGVPPGPTPTQMALPL